MKVIASLVLASLCLAAGPATEPASQPSAPKRVVFAIDATGSMINQLGTAKRETLAALRQMQPRQLFAVIISDEDGKTRSVAKALLPATPANIEKAATFLDPITASGAGDNEPAILAAIALRPEVIWAITDGDMAKPDAEIARIVAANKGHARINTAVIFSDGDQANRHNLWQLAAKNHGQCIGANEDPGVSTAAAPVPKQPSPAPKKPDNKPTIFQEN